MPDDDAKLVAKAEAAISKKDVEEARRKAEIAAIERQAKIGAWSDYIEFVTAKLIGLAGTVVGGIEYVAPDILPIVLARPGLIASVGLTLLTGKAFLSLLAKVDKVLKILEEK